MLLLVADVCSAKRTASSVSLERPRPMAHVSPGLPTHATRPLSCFSQMVAEHVHLHACMPGQGALKHCCLINFINKKMDGNGVQAKSFH